MELSYGDFTVPLNMNRNDCFKLMHTYGPKQASAIGL